MLTKHVFISVYNNSNAESPITFNVQLLLKKVSFEFGLLGIAYSVNEWISTRSANDNKSLLLI